MVVSTTDQLQDIFAEEERLEAEGMRYLMIPERESLWVAVKRRAGLVWGCLTLRPHPDFQDEFLTFRKSQHRYERVFPGHPQYDQADTLGPRLFRKTLTGNPWLDILEGNRFPQGASPITLAPNEEIKQ